MNGFMGDFTGKVVNVTRTGEKYTLEVRTPQGYTIAVKPKNNKNLPNFAEIISYRYGFGGPKQI